MIGPASHRGRRFNRRQALASIGLVLVTIACGNRSRQPESTSAPAPESFIFSSEDGSTTRFWLADPAKPSVRRLLQEVRHEPGWAGAAAVSPDGKTLVYTILRPGFRDPDRGADLAATDLRGRQNRALASGVDLRSTLTWERDGGIVIYQRFEGQEQQFWLQPAEGGAATLLLRVPNAERAIPIGRDRRAGRLLVATFTATGIDLEGLPPNGVPESVTRLPEGAARNFTLSSSGDRLAFLSTTAGESGTVSRGFVLDLQSTTLRELPANWGNVVGLAWAPNDVLLIGTSGPSAGLWTEAGSHLPAPAARGFLQPLASSPSGRYLAVRTFTGDTVDQPGAARDALLDQAGNFLAIVDSQPVRFVGWISGTNEHAKP